MPVSKATYEKKAMALFLLDKLGSGRKGPGHNAEVGAPEGPMKNSIVCEGDKCGTKTVRPPAGKQLED